MVWQLSLNLRNIFTAKQVDVYHTFRHSPKLKLLILTGAVRAGKTYIDNFLFLQSVKEASKVAKENGQPFAEYILAGATAGSIQTNVLDELQRTFNLNLKPDRHNRFTIKFKGLPPVKIRQAYTGSKSGVKSIKGMTASGAYINEGSMASEEVFEEIISRCSERGAKVICDTNPDVPTHFIKKMIDQAREEHNPRIIAKHFTIFDNRENLDPDYLQAMVNSKSGVFYERDILGLWSSGQGLVYADFDRKRNEITRQEFHQRFTESQRKHMQYIAGVDWGFGHKGCIVVLAIYHNHDFYMIEEHTRLHKNQPYWLNVAHQIVDRYGNIPFYCDSARPDYVSAFQEQGLNAINAFKYRLSGCDMVATLIKTGHFHVIKECIDEFEKELYAYTWDEDKGEPIKKNDDVMDALRYPIATFLRRKHAEHATVAITQSYDDKQAILGNLGLA